MKIAILTGGGDVAPLNAVISSVQQECNRLGFELFGVLRGWAGLLNNDLVRLNGSFIDPHIGGTILRSSRVNLSEVSNGPLKVTETLNDNNINGLIVIGGEDTLSNALHIKGFPKVLISKTIDNDVGEFSKGRVANYFTLGYPTAAEKISSFISFREGLRTTAYSHERIMVVESMGMHAGWLALSSSLGNPDFIIIPEFPLNYDDFIGSVRSRFLEQRHVIIVISEGARWHDGSFISADESEKDSFGHPRFRGTAEVLAGKLKHDLKPFFDTRNVNSVNPSYLYRSGKPNSLDYKTACQMGISAVSHFMNDPGGTVFLSTELSDDGFSITPFPFNSLDNIEQFHRFVDSSLYDAATYMATSFAREYLSVISDPFPEFNISF